MRKVILFTEMTSERTRRTAKQFAEEGNIVYALVGKEEAKNEQGIHELEADRSSEADVKRALSRISEEYLDLLVLSAGRHCEGDGPVTEPHDYKALLQVLNENVVCAFTVVNTVLPLLRAGEGKRIAVLTEKTSSMNLNQNTGDFGYQMSLASINMMERILFNTLRREGFTFRNYAVSDTSEGMSAAQYLRKNLCYDEKDAYIHSDENRLVMRDALLCELPW